MSDIIKQIAEWIKKYQHFLIISHEGGDGDSIGSQLALAFILNKLQKEFFILNKDPIPNIYNFLPGAEWIKTQIDKNLEEYEVVFFLDCGSMERTGLSLPQGVQYINIDHHLNNDQFGHLNWVNPRMSSTSEMIYHLWHTLSIPMDVSIGENLYTGLLTDTGCFRYSNTSSQCLHIAGNLIEAGVDPSRVASQVYERKSSSQLLFLASALSNLKLTEDQKIAYIYLGKDVFQRYGATREDTEGFVNYPLAIDSVEVALLFKEVSKDFFKISFRSKGRVNVAAIAGVFNGGGHYNAAGAKIKGSFISVWNRVSKVIYEQSSF